MAGLPHFLFFFGIGSLVRPSPASGAKLSNNNKNVLSVPGWGNYEKMLFSLPVISQVSPSEKRQ
jgi:hypothetical protein